MLVIKNITCTWVFKRKWEIEMYGSYEHSMKYELRSHDTGNLDCYHLGCDITSPGRQGISVCVSCDNHLLGTF